MSKASSGGPDETVAPSGLTTSEEDVVRRCAEESEKTLQDWERNRAKIAASMEYQGAVRVIATIEQPSEEEYAQISKAVNRAFASLSGKAKNVGGKLQSELLKKYTDYPAPVKIVTCLRSQKDRNSFGMPLGTEYVVERFVESAESMILTDSGGMTFNNLTLMRRVLPERYSHLFQEADFQQADSQ